ncbi:MAG: aminomethyl-transferring glycine dehydrogenase subunit GcvPA [Deltaproteobacteria bacterium]|nr:aminomethyl-transferring glycine dehydrogenase subunit GcvPA [Deltaproteobacteria bacterium]
MPNSEPRTKQAMLDALGIADVDELYEQIPEDHRLKDQLGLPEALTSEVDLRRHLLQALAKNETCEENLSFLGAGCWQHHVPAICDEIAARSEFVTNIWGTPSSDHGRNQALFEFCSQIGELTNMDCVGLPVYSWGCAAGHAIRMAARLTGRREVVLPRSLDPERLSVIRTYCEPRETRNHIDVTMVDYDSESGQLDLDALASTLSRDVAAVYLENPSYLGVIETQGAEVARLAHECGVEVIVGVDPISLGLLAAPADYGADFTVGTIQPLGLHMSCGGSMGGFIATRDDERYVGEYPTLLLSLCETVEAGEHAFVMTLLEQSSYDAREEGKDWTGHTVHLWAVVSAAYMALMGPEGFAEVGKLIISRSHYAATRLGELDGVRIVFPAGFFKEFLVNVDGTGKTVAEINRGLRRHGIFGGKDVSKDFPELGQSALYCVTEVHTQTDIDRLVDALREVITR